MSENLLSNNIWHVGEKFDISVAFDLYRFSACFTPFRYTEINRYNRKDKPTTHWHLKKHKAQTNNSDFTFEHHSEGSRCPGLLNTTDIQHTH